VPLAGAGLAGASTPTCQPWKAGIPGDDDPGALVGVAATPNCEEWAVGTADTETRMLHVVGDKSAFVTSPNPGGDRHTNSLEGVAATDSTNAWAVGDYATGKALRTLVLHWNGSVWSQVASPNPGGPKNAAGLIGVAAISASSAWAVGSYSNGKARQTLILRGNTTSWAQVHSPSPGGLTHDSRLTSVAVVSARDAWAVGYYQTAQAFRRTLILHWNGKSWSQMPSPDPGGSSHGNLLFGVSATSARDAWAVGYDTTKSDATTLVLHWNGQAWTKARSPNLATGPGLRIDHLQGVAATSADNAWAVGYYQHSGVGFFPLIEHWDGKAWHTQHSPDQLPGEEFLISVTAGADGTAMAVGGFNEEDEAQDFAVYWNGTKWQF
jgi:hypothetical protein